MCDIQIRRYGHDWDPLTLVDIQARGEKFEVKHAARSKQYDITCVEPDGKFSKAPCDEGRVLTIKLPGYPVHKEWMQPVTAIYGEITSDLFGTEIPKYKRRYWVNVPAFPKAYSDALTNDRWLTVDPGDVNMFVNTYIMDKDSPSLRSSSSSLVRSSSSSGASK